MIQKSAIYRGRVCPARNFPISNRLSFTAGPHMYGPYVLTYYPKEVLFMQKIPANELLAGLTLAEPVSIHAVVFYCCSFRAEQAADVVNISCSLLSASGHRVQKF